MIYQKDWLMRQIESMIAAIMHLLSHTSKQENEVSLTEEIDCFLEQGDICGAEDWLYENLDGNDIRWLHASVYFYKKLNAYSDEYLADHNFGRDEIVTGLTDVSERFGFGHIL